MKTISLEQLLIFHGKILKETGGLDGVRDMGVLESALNKPFLTFDGQDLYKGLCKKISTVTFSLIKNHGFVDGNKRISVATMLLLLKLNDISVRYKKRSSLSLDYERPQANMRKKILNNGF